MSCPSPDHLPNPETEPESLVSPALTGAFFTPGATWEVPRRHKETFHTGSLTQKEAVATTSPVLTCHYQAGHKFIMKESKSEVTQ